jgi:hypothetical protein
MAILLREGDTICYTAQHVATAGEGRHLIASRRGIYLREEPGTELVRVHWGDLPNPSFVHRFNICHPNDVRASDRHAK